MHFLELLLAIIVTVAVTRYVLRQLFSSVTGGVIRQTRTTSMVPITPGNSPKFYVTPTFSGSV